MIEASKFHLTSDRLLRFESKAAQKWLWYRIEAKQK